MKSIILAALLTGCSGVKPLGHVGNLEFSSVHSARLASPSFNALVVCNTNTHQVTVEQVFGGSGLSPSIIAGLSHIGASAVVGMAFPDTETIVDQRTPAPKLAAPKDSSGPGRRTLPQSPKGKQ